MVPDLIIPTAEIFKGQIYMQSIKLNVSIPEDNSTVNVDKVRVQQVVINLISNALKFTPRKGAIRLKIEKSVISDSKIGYRIIVHD